MCSQMVYTHLLLCRNKFRSAWKNVAEVVSYNHISEATEHADAAVHLRANFQQWRHAKQETAGSNLMNSETVYKYAPQIFYLPPNGEAGINSWYKRKSTNYRMQYVLSKHYKPRSGLSKTISICITWEDSSFYLIQTAHG